MPAEDDFLLLPQNDETVQAFKQVQTQSRYTQGVRVGLDYAGCKVALEAAGIDIQRVFRGLRVMEAAVLDDTNTA